MTKEEFAKSLDNETLLLRWARLLNDYDFDNQKQCDLEEALYSEILERMKEDTK